MTLPLLEATIIFEGSVENLASKIAYLFSHSSKKEAQVVGSISRKLALRVAKSVIWIVPSKLVDIKLFPLISSEVVCQ